MREKRKKMKEGGGNARDLRSKNQAEIQRRIDEATNLKQAIIDVSREINERKRKRRIRESANNQTDFVTRNVE